MGRDDDVSINFDFTVYLYLYSTNEEYKRFVKRMKVKLCFMLYSKFFITPISFIAWRPIYKFLINVEADLENNNSLEIS